MAETSIPMDIQPKLTVLHMRNGRVMDTITPLSDASWFGKLLHILRLRNYTST